MKFHPNEIDTAPIKKKNTTKLQLFVFNIMQFEVPLMDFLSFNKISIGVNILRKFGSDPGRQRNVM